MIELAGGPDGAQTSAAVQILLVCQREGDPVAWIQPEGGELYPPDLAAAGLDLGALLVVHIPRRAGAPGPAKAAELILRTGAFGGLAIDLSASAVPRGDAWLGRLAALVREHDSRCVFLGPGASSPGSPSPRSSVARPSNAGAGALDPGSFGPLVSVRIFAQRERLRPGRYVMRSVLLKDKSGLRPTLPGPRAWVGPSGMS